MKLPIALRLAAVAAGLSPFVAPARAQAPAGPTPNIVLRRGRRPRLRRRRLLRPAEDPHALDRPARGAGPALHAALLRQRRVRAVAQRADDGAAPRAHPGPRQPGGAARGPVAAARRDGHARRAAQGPRLRDRRDGQVGPRRRRAPRAIRCARASTTSSATTASARRTTTIPPYLWDDARRITLDNPAFPAHQPLPAGADPADPQSYARYSGRQYAPDLTWERARAFVRENRGRPFFLFVPTTVPHLALQVPEDSLAEYRGRFPETPYRGDKSYLPHPTPRAAYAAMVTRMDREVGRLLALLHELELDERTIVVFTSDNGPTFDVGGADAAFFRSAGPFRGLKGSLYEGGVRVPAIVRWTGHVRGRTGERSRHGLRGLAPDAAGAGRAPAIPAGPTASASRRRCSATPSRRGRSSIASSPATAGSSRSASATGRACASRCRRAPRPAPARRRSNSTT